MLGVCNRWADIRFANYCLLGGAYGVVLFCLSVQYMDHAIRKMIVQYAQARLSSVLAVRRSDMAYIGCHLGLKAIAGSDMYTSLGMSKVINIMQAPTIQTDHVQSQMQSICRSRLLSQSRNPRQSR